MSTILTGMPHANVVPDPVTASPDLTSLSDKSDELAMLAAIQKGLDDIEAGRVISNEEAKRRSAKWITK
jgi:hypothetical protein